MDYRAHTTRYSIRAVERENGLDSPRGSASVGAARGFGSTRRSASWVWFHMSAVARGRLGFPSMPAHTANVVRAAWSWKEFTIASMPTKKHLQWAADALGPGTVVRTVEGLHGPWRLGMDDGRTLHEVIRRVARGGSRHT